MEKTKTGYLARHDTGNYLLFETMEQKEQFRKWEDKLARVMEGSDRWYDYYDEYREKFASYEVPVSELYKNRITIHVEEA